MGPGIDPVSSWILVRFITAELKREILACHSLIDSYLFSLSQVYKIMWLLSSDGILYLIKSLNYGIRIRGTMNGSKKASWEMYQIA